MESDVYMPDAKWKRIFRVGTPDLMKTSQQFNETRIIVYTAPAMADPHWRGYFRAKVSQFDISAAHDSSSGGRDAISAYAKDDDSDIVRVIEAIDAAIEYANDKYESDVLPYVVAERNAKAAKEAEAIRRQAELDKLAAKLAKPE